MKIVDQELLDLASKVANRSITDHMEAVNVLLDIVRSTENAKDLLGIKEPWWKYIFKRDESGKLVPLEPNEVPPFTLVSKVQEMMDEEKRLRQELETLKNK